MAESLFRGSPFVAPPEEFVAGMIRTDTEPEEVTPTPEALDPAVARRAVAFLLTTGGLVLASVGIAFVLAWPYALIFAGCVLILAGRRQ